MHHSFLRILNREEIAHFPAAVAGLRGGVALVTAYAASAVRQLSCRRGIRGNAPSRNQKLNKGPRFAFVSDTAVIDMCSSSLQAWHLRGTRALRPFQAFNCVL